jgi:hypothetical protein
MDQLAANAEWVKSIDAAFAEKRAAAREQSLRADETRALYQTDPAFRTVRPEAGGAQSSRGRGILIDYNDATQTGLISAEDGKRWAFYRGDWADFMNEPMRGLWVDFVPENESGYALFVYSLGPFIPRHLQLENAR